jgi:hypothetical protein
MKNFDFVIEKPFIKVVFENLETYVAVDLHNFGDEMKHTD